MQIFLFTHTVPLEKSNKVRIHLSKVLGEKHSEIADLCKGKMFPPQLSMTDNVNVIMVHTVLTHNSCCCE